MTRKSASCTTMLVGKNASLDGSTLIARNEDAGSVPTTKICRNPT